MTGRQRTQPDRRDESGGRTNILAQFQDVRALSESLAAPLAAEDQVVQSMPDASPTKWHLAHVTWFFETFLLEPLLPDYEPFHPKFRYLFNSYYEQVGPQYPRPERGLMSRPTATEVLRYRAYVDDAMARLIETEDDRWDEVAALIELGLNHEQQHQELLLTDIKHVFACNPLDPVYQPQRPVSREPLSPLTWLDYEGGLVEIGHNGCDFSFDNENPRHRVHIEPYRLASRPVTNGEYLAFIEDGGYTRPELWLSDGWAALQERGWKAPLHWWHDGKDWTVMTLSGRHRANRDEPLCHVSYYEANAYAHWSGHRLPTEAEWETAAPAPQSNDNTLARGYLHPLPAVGGASDSDAPLQMFGDVWEWTCSSYSPYPGFRAATGAVGEYNGKFMINQMVLRGGSCVTPPGHIRASYRNFFPADARWQFSGIRLAGDGG